MSRNFEVLSKALQEDLLQVESSPQEQVEVESGSLAEQPSELCRVAAPRPGGTATDESGAAGFPARWGRGAADGGVCGSGNGGGM